MKINHRGKQWFVVGLLIHSLCLAAPVEQPSRTRHAMGFYLGILSDPVISLVSANLAYNLNENFRVNGGVGYFPYFSLSSYSFGGGLKYFLFGDSNFTPVVGLNLSVAQIDVSGIVNAFTDAFGGSPIGVTYATVLIGAANIGCDWQTDLGFNLGFGANVAYAGSFAVIPYLNLGLFF